MKVLLIHGNPNERGCTDTDLSEIAETPKGEGVDQEWAETVRKILEFYIK